MERRDFIKYATGASAALMLGTKLPWLGAKPAQADHIARLDITITDCIKEMATFNALSVIAGPGNGECYFWIYKMTATLGDGRVIDLPADCPGPTLFATTGDIISLRITNALDEPHSLVIRGMFNSGPIPPDGVPRDFIFAAGAPGTYLYFDSLNAPVNRVMGLHGAFVVMPAAPAAGQKWTPYANPTPQVQQLFNDLGAAAHFPGLAWEQANAPTQTPPFRQYIWLLSQASPLLFRDVGSLPAGQIFPAAEFVRRFTRDAFGRNSHDLTVASDIPQYFTSMGQSGHFSHNNPVVTPMARVGEPCVLRVLNAGLMTHSMHIHANHFYLLSVDGVVMGAPVPANATLTRPGVIWVDTFQANQFGAPSSRYDILMLFQRPPDVHNVRGIGLADAPLPTANGATTWPPVEEFDLAFGNTIPVRLSPLCYPAHDHSEPSQTSQGGNYNCGVIGGQYFIGDLNITLPRFNVNDRFAAPGSNPDMPLLPPQTFPMDEDFAMMLGLDQVPQILVYGIDEARRDGVMGPSKDSELLSQTPRPPFPPPFVDPAFP